MGIYFLIKRCGIIYLYADKGTFATAPYLDVHGEADPGFRKHRPLFLNKEALAKPHSSYFGCTQARLNNRSRRLEYFLNAGWHEILSI
jgi:hypothetical protein